MIHRPIIPVLGPYESKCFSKYFKGVDLLLSQRLSLGFSSDEEHITSTLCELLDDRGSSLHLLPYNLSSLNYDLQKNSGLLNANIIISTKNYNKYEEHHKTQSDLGIILEYKDYIEPSYDFKRGVLIQAKKLFPTSGNNYGLDSEYESFDSAQHDRIESLNKLFKDKKCGSDYIKYLMYNPPFEVMSKNEQQKILHRQKRLDSELIFDYSTGLNRYQELFKGDKYSILNSGCIFSSVDTIHNLAVESAKNRKTVKSLYKFTLESLINAINIYESSLSWFFVIDLMTMGKGCYCNEFIDLINSRDRLNSENFIPPKYSITIRITAGGDNGR
jgi:hypothetical protein